MKTKIVTLLLVSAMAFTGCSSNSKNSADATSTQKESADTSKIAEKDTTDEAQPEENTKTDSAEKEDTKERSLAGIEQYMLDAGYLTGERTQKAAEMLGAIDGFGYDCGVEIYQYDTNSETYASVAAGEEIPLQGMSGYSVKFNAVNGEFALILPDGEESNQALIDAFMAY